MSIFKRFTFNPFEPLHQLLDKIDGCMSHVEPMLEANFEGRYDVVKDHFRAITKAEHEADVIKTEIRTQLKRSMFMPIDRWHFLDIISAADNIADTAEDLAYLITIRNTNFPDGLKDHFADLSAKVMECYKQLTSTVAYFEELVESGFSGPMADEVAEGIEKVCHLEWETDKIMYKLSQHIFQLEDQVPVVDLFFINDIARKLGHLADVSERLAKQLKRTIAG